MKAGIRGWLGFASEAGVGALGVFSSQVLIFLLAVILIVSAIKVFQH